MPAENRTTNEYMEEVFCSDKGHMDFRLPVDKALDKPLFQAIFKITGYLVFGDDDLRPINDTYCFLSIETDDIPQDFMLQRIRYVYGVDTASLGSTVEFQYERLE